MPRAFDAHNPAFDRVTHDEIEELRAALDIGYFRPGETIIEKGQAADSLHVVIKGSVEERDGDAIEALLGPKESFEAARWCTARPASASSRPRRRSATLRPRPRCWT